MTTHRGSPRLPRPKGAWHTVWSIQYWQSPLPCVLVDRPSGQSSPTQSQVLYKCGRIRANISENILTISGEESSQHEQDSEVVINLQKILQCMMKNWQTLPIWPNLYKVCNSGEVFMKELIILNSILSS
jgi:hypothetical protein